MWVHSTYLMGVSTCNEPYYLKTPKLGIIKSKSNENMSRALVHFQALPRKQNSSAQITPVVHKRQKPSLSVELMAVGS